MLKRMFFCAALALPLLVSAPSPARAEAQKAEAKILFAEEKDTENLCETTANLNLRFLPGMESESLGVIPSGAVFRVQCRNRGGWALVRYKKKKGYCSEKYLKFGKDIISGKETVTDSGQRGIVIGEKDDVPNARAVKIPLAEYVEGRQIPEAGRFLIPDIGVNVGLYRHSFSEDLSVTQAAVDREDSAAEFTDSAVPILADHKNQGFAGMENAKEGMRAYIVYPDGTVKTYVISEITDGYNSGYQIATNDGRLLQPNQSPISADLSLYTCLESWQHVRIIFFRLSAG